MTGGVKEQAVKNKENVLTKPRQDIDTKKFCDVSTEISSSGVICLNFFFFLLTQKKDR